VIKNALAKVLTHKRLLKRVLAFCTAKQIDGGAGAMYVLLRKWQKP
jgi:DNA-nicking Smr family endonuclease